MIEPFFKKHGCVELVMDEYRERVCVHEKKPGKMFCASLRDCRTKIDICIFDAKTNQFPAVFEISTTISFEIRISKMIYACGKIFVFDDWFKVSDSI